MLVTDAYSLVNNAIIFRTVCARSMRRGSQHHQHGDRELIRWIKSVLFAQKINEDTHGAIPVHIRTSLQQRVPTHHSSIVSTMPPGPDFEHSRYVDGRPRGRR